MVSINSCHLLKLCTRIVNSNSLITRHAFDNATRSCYYRFGNMVMFWLLHSCSSQNVRTYLWLSSGWTVKYSRTSAQRDHPVIHHIAVSPCLRSRHIFLLFGPLSHPSAFSRPRVPYGLKKCSKSAVIVVITHYVYRSSMTMFYKIRVLASAPTTTGGGLRPPYPC